MIVCGGPASHLSHFSSQDCGEETKVEIGIVIELEVEMELKLLLTAADLLTQGIEIHFIGTSIFPAFSFSLSLSLSLSYQQLKSSFIFTIIINLLYTTNPVPAKHHLQHHL